ncbi:MAG TPA: right-handed parallel beta-helix repeat-containing protein [Solirubrobacteraceae bacterium]|nr:right-handed parallel beta-helix repeat-containing protein [Solirubrobacteraceae bacterium]
MARRLATSLFAALALLVCAGAASASARVLIVTQRHVSYTHYTSIQAAVNAAHPGDWIVIAPGVYAGPVVIRTPRLHVRGMNRNKVIVDGRHHVGNGITVFSSGVWVENLTVRNFDRRTREDAADGNEIWWEGAGADGSRIGIHGWWGQYLTAYDTGLLGGYGEYTSHAVDGFFKHIYASGMNDSGVYVGGCRDCQALVQDALMERNALGWSSTNAGGHLIVEDSIFRDNSIGVGPDSEPDDDLPPPQDGACNSASNRAELPTFTSTQIDRCTIFRDNVIEDNGNISTPANSDILNAPWGVGVILGGDYADLIENNTIRDNPTFGVLVLERPDPFPPTSKTVYFQSQGNEVSGNQIVDNATQPGTFDIGLEGGAFGTQNSVDNCFSDNVFGTSSPPSIEGTWGCQNASTPNGGLALFNEILTLIGQSGARHQRPQPAPAPQPTMPRPCRGVPRNALCP